MKKIIPILALYLVLWPYNSFSQNQQQNNQVTFSTFTAAPIAHYNHIWLHPRNTDLTNPCKPGIVFFSASQNDLIYCQDDGTGNNTGTFEQLGGGIWKKVGSDIFPAKTPNSAFEIGIGTSAPSQALEVADANNVLFDSKSGDFFWMSSISNLGIGPTDVTSKLHHNNILINLDSVSAVVAPVRNARFTIVGGTAIIGALEHNHVGVGGGFGGGANPMNTVFTVVGDSDFVGKTYFHDDITMEGDLNVIGTVSAGNFSGPANFSHITTNTIQVSSRGWVGADSCPFGSHVEWCVTGDLGYTESIYSQSDERVKTNITPIGKSMDIITQLKPVTYQLKEYSMDNNGQILISDTFKKQTHIGLIAQEVYKILPEIVQKPADENTGIWSISYNELIPVLIQAVKEHKSETDQWKAETTALKSEMNLLKQEIEKLKNQQQGE